MADGCFEGNSYQVGINVRPGVGGGWGGRRINLHTDPLE